MTTDSESGTGVDTDVDADLAAATTPPPGEEGEVSQAHEVSEPGDEGAAPKSENEDTASKPAGVLNASVLRSMDEDTDRLAEDLDEVRTAVQAAHRASSMAPAGEDELPRGEGAG